MKFALLALFTVASAAVPAPDITVSWDKVERVSNTTATLQVVVNPLLRRGSRIHDRVFAELKNLGADAVRYVPWFPYPRLAIAELNPPEDGRTSWDFTLLDPMTTDFLEATKGHSVVLNFSTIPPWMFQIAKPIEYPQDPEQVSWDYLQGTELRDPLGSELGAYYARLVSWYARGGFTDELGREHRSGHHFSIPYWEVLNEPDLEHQMSAQQYTARYDAIVSAIRAVSPGTKFVGLSLAFPGGSPEMFEYFLDHRNHKPGIPLDMISYHFYATPAEDEPPEAQPYTLFSEVDGFLNTVRFVEAIRKRLSPETGTMINEIGCISTDDFGQNAPGHVMKPIPDSYWSLCGAVYAYAYGHLNALGIDVAGESQLVGYPSQFPSVSMVDWNTGAPNARFRVLQLLKTNFVPGDRIVAVANRLPTVYALACIGAGGERKLLLVNERDRDIDVSFGDRVKQMQSVDFTTRGAPAVSTPVDNTMVRLHGFAVAVLSFETLE